MRPVTLAIHQDEKCAVLRELNLVRPPTFQWHRWQIVTVIRNDQLAEWWDDLGLAENFTAPEIEIPSLGEHSVAELRDIAEGYRMENHWKQRALELSGESSLIPDLLDSIEERQRIINNRSSIGRYSKQRNGFDRRAALEYGNRRSTH